MVNVLDKGDKRWRVGLGKRFKELDVTFGKEGNR